MSVSFTVVPIEAHVLGTELCYDLYCLQIPTLTIGPGWWIFPSGATLTARTPSASPTRSSRWLSTRSQPSLSRLREGGGKIKSIHKICYQTTNFDRISDMTVNSRDLEVSPNPSWGKRPRPPRSWSSSWSALSVSGKTRYFGKSKVVYLEITVYFRLPSREPSISSWEVRENARDRWFSSKCFPGYFLKYIYFLWYSLLIFSLTTSNMYQIWCSTISGPRTGILFLIRFDLGQNRDV